MNLDFLVLFKFIFGLAALIFIHELGHFIAARLMNIEVEEFGIGFPPRLVKLFEYKGTEYTLNWIPLGGFVRPKGENDPSIEGGLAAANPWARLVVLFAGPFMNLVAAVLLAVVFIFHEGEQTPLIDYVEPGSPAAEIGLLKGDLFLEVDGQPIYSVTKLQNVVGDNLGQPIDVIVKRGEEIIIVNLTPRPNPPPEQGAMGVGLDVVVTKVPLNTAISHGALITYDSAVNIARLPVRLLRGQAKPEETRLVGYKGMYDIYERVQRDQSPLWFFSIISLSLGIMNLLPIPALDGGRIFLTLPEILIRRRIPPQYETAIHMVGFAVLLLLLFYINLQDFINPLEFPN
ncbi:MAG: site-2 protease family protein [Anaerolineales bacterium]|nr:site-2 protease family protein [Anaerolineales bacterium]